MAKASKSVGRKKSVFKSCSIENLESRMLLSTVTLTANVADRGVKSNATLLGVSDKTIRSGDNGTNATEQAAIFPFLLPTLPVGAVITSASLTMTLQSVANAKSIVGTDDLYGRAFRSTPTVITADYFEGAAGASSDTLLQAGFATKTSVTGAVSTSAAANTALASYLTAQYNAGGAGNYIFLRLNAQSNQLKSRFWAWYTANAAAGQKPVLTITYDVPVVVPVTPAAPTNLGLVTNPGAAINLTWTNNAATSTGVAVQRSIDGTNFTTIATLSPTATSYLDNTGLAADTKYFYRVYTANGAASSAFTPVLSDTTLPTFATQTIWVDTVNGLDTNAGTFAAPLKTIAKAMALPSVKATPAGTGLVLRGGTYHETAVLLSGSAAAPFTIMAEPNETAVISGFQSITGWTQYSGNIYSTTLNWNPDTLYVNDTPQDMSRAPDQGWFVPQSAVQVASPATTTITDPTHLNPLGNLVGSFVQWHSAASNTYFSAQVTSQNTAAGTITFNTPSGASFASTDQYVVKNLLSLVSRPGEWASVSNGAGGYTMYFNPVNVADLAATQSRFMTGRQIQATGASHDIVIRNLTVVGNRTGFGIDVEGTLSGTTVTYAKNITVENNIVANNFNNGIWYRWIQDSTIKNNVVLSNANGIGLADGLNILITGNEVAYNVTDGIDIAGDVHFAFGVAGFAPTRNVTISYNYIHDQLGYGHCDGIQMYNYVYNINILNNFIRDCGQGIMTQEVDYDLSTNAATSDWSTISGNTIVDIGANSVILGHGNSYNWNISNNTIGGAGFSPFSFTASGYNLTENILLGKQIITGSAAAMKYTGDRNFYYINPSSQYSPYIISASGPPWTNYSTVAAFFAAQGQDQHSQQGDPIFSNSPIVESMIKDISLSTLNSVQLWNTAGFVVGDYIEINRDGVARKITAVNATTKVITFDIALSALPMSQELIVDDWKTNSNFNLDLRLKPGSGSVALTMSSTGGPIGSQINGAQYVAGDFNGDGVRDLPTVSASIAAGLPNTVTWAPPSY